MGLGHSLERECSKGLANHCTFGNNVKPQQGVYILGGNGYGRPATQGAGQLRPQAQYPGLLGRYGWGRVFSFPSTGWLQLCINLVVISWTEARSSAFESFRPQASKYCFLLLTEPQLLWRVVAKVRLWITEDPVCGIPC